MVIIPARGLDHITGIINENEMKMKVEIRYGLLYASVT
jgi:hypothetical protein